MPGALLGEMSCLDGQPHSATVKALTDSTARVFTAGELNDQLSRMNEILEEKVQARTREIREANISAIYMLAVASDAKDKDTD